VFVPPPQLSLDLHAAVDTILNMPTVHVTLESDLLLQVIANSLFKAKKVVVVTGAGISTNSGIPVSWTLISMREVKAKYANMGGRTFAPRTVSIL
jgi:hypothetical protein